MTLFILLLIVGGLYVYARIIEPGELNTDSTNVIVPEDVSEGTVVFFSDTHFGRYYNEDRLDRIVTQINGQNPDIVIFGGDLIDNYNRDRSYLDTQALIEGLSKIDARYGKFAVYGNHDYGGGAEQIYTQIMEESGFTILKNDTVQITEMNLQITGYDDLLFGTTPSGDYDLSGGRFSLIVSHEPDTADDISIPEDAVMVSGHSHGGQITIPFLTEFYLPDGATKYLRGWYDNLGKNSNISLLVSRGIGVTGLPFRFLSSPEINVIHLVHT